MYTHQAGHRCLKAGLPYVRATLFASCMLAEGGGKKNLAPQHSTGDGRTQDVDQPTNGTVRESCIRGRKKQKMGKKNLSRSGIT